MDTILLAFYSALLLCAAYASKNGGRTGKTGSAIFIVATILSAAAVRMNPSWAGTSLGLFAVDAGCLLALIMLALASNRFWPIWALGFQIVAVATHLATLFIPDVVPKSFQALLSFWTIPILGVMVAGTHKDRQHELSISR
jgi:asparagine N-glycosylation enzyme membrane subunit Stt3